MMTTGYAGYYGTPGFQNKADALKYAMELSYRIDENGGYFLDKASLSYRQSLSNH